MNSTVEAAPVYLQETKTLNDYIEPVTPERWRQGSAEWEAGLWNLAEEFPGAVVSAEATRRDVLYGDDLR